MNRLLSLQEKIINKPFGKKIFSVLVARSAPYFTTIKPHIHELKHNYIKVSMPKRKAVQNHIKTVHAIAMCNLCEFAAGVCMEASIPKHRRWIPVGMEVSYLKKATTDLTTSCNLDFVDWENCDEVPCEISIRDQNDQEVAKAVIRMKVSDKK